VAEEADSYEEAVRLLSVSHNIAPSYLIISGVKRDEGVVLEKGRFKVDHRRELSTSNGVWYLVQTNWEDRHGGDMPFDQRRRPAEKKLDRMGPEGTSYESLFSGILEEYPTWRGDKNSTVHATVMAAGGNYMFTKIYDHKAFKELSAEELKSIDGKSARKEDL
jgi:hypothetical protein